MSLHGASMSGSAAALLAILLTGLVTTMSVRPALGALSRTRGTEDEPFYADLNSPPFVVGCGLTAAAAAAIAWLLLPAAVRPAWLVLASLGVLLAAIDLRTTWLPWRLIRVAWLLMAVALVAGALAGATPSLALRALTGAVAAGLLYLTAWALTRGGFGFGDVRFAPLLGAAAAADSWRLLLTVLLLGTLVGGLHGLVRLLRRRPGPFPYGPAMLAGAFLAVAVRWLR